MSGAAEAKGVHADSHADSEKLDLLLANARQLLAIVQATYPEVSFEINPRINLCNHLSSSDITLLACEWQNIQKLIEMFGVGKATYDEVKDRLLAFSRKAQEMMSGTASNYDLTRLVEGIGVAAVALLLALSASFKSLYNSGAAGLFFLAVLVSYSIMMFASSYVEEEQHFWYWMQAGWLAWLFAKE